jgi:phosphohistidine phosphatase
MKTFILVRHTKSSWKDTSLSDIERPLKKSRLEDAFKVSNKLRELGFKPDLIISSHAKRAFDTASIFAKALSYGADKIKIEPSIYECTEKELLKAISSINKQFERVMIFGHNPCFETFLAEYTDSTVTHLPTTGTVWLEIDEKDWKITKRKKAIQRHFLYPKMFTKIQVED